MSVEMVIANYRNNDSCEDSQVQARQSVGFDIV